jgi:hypothetical protein
VEANRLAQESEVADAATAYIRQQADKLQLNPEMKMLVSQSCVMYAMGVAHGLDAAIKIVKQR